AWRWRCRGEPSHRSRGPSRTSTGEWSGAGAIGWWPSRCAAGREPDILESEKEPRLNGAIMISSLSFVFPMYNEIDNLERTVREATEVGRRITSDLEIVIVDDASTDGSGGLADRLADENRHVRAVQPPSNRKLGSALKTRFVTVTPQGVV